MINQRWNVAFRTKGHPLSTSALAQAKLQSTVKPNILRLRFRQLTFKLRVLLHKANIALNNIRITRLKRKCQRLNLVDDIHIPPIFRTRLKVFGEVNDVFDCSHSGLAPIWWTEGV